jgi:hypothetical protein
MLEGLLLVTGLTAISLATTALFDLFAGPRSWPRKAAWAVLVVSLPVVGPVLYYLYAPRELPRGARRRARASRALTPQRDDQPGAELPEEPEAADGPAANAEPADREHAQPPPRP